MRTKGKLKYYKGKWLPSLEESSRLALVEREAQRREGDSFWTGFLAGAAAWGFLSVVIFGAAILL